MNMEIQINRDIWMECADGKHIYIEDSIGDRGFITFTIKEMDAIVEAYLKERYPLFAKDIVARIDAIKEMIYP